MYHVRYPVSEVDDDDHHDHDRDISSFSNYRFAECSNLVRIRWKPTYQSSTLLRDFGMNGNSWKAVDGNTDPDYTHKSCSHTEVGLSRQWWAVDLRREYSISRVVVYNRNAYGGYLWVVAASVWETAVLTKCMDG